MGLLCRPWLGGFGSCRPYWLRCKNYAELRSSIKSPTKGAEMSQRTRILLVIAGLSGIFSAQSNLSLRQKYGRPISETYQVRPGIASMVSYGADGQVCEAVIRPDLPTTPIKSSSDVLKSKELDDVIEE